MKPKTYRLRQQSRNIFTLNLHDELMLITFLRFLDFNKLYFKIKGEQIKTVLKMKLNLNMCIRNTKYLSIRITTVYTADFLVPIQWTRNDLHSGESTHKNNNITTRSISLTNKKWQKSSLTQVFVNIKFISILQLFEWKKAHLCSH